MADPFETQLQRLFAEPQSFADAAAFATRIQDRLERSWAVRRISIGAAGALGGLIAAAQFVGSHLAERASAASEVADSHVRDVTSELTARGAVWLSALHLPNLGAEPMVLIAGLVATALALAAARVLERL